MAVVQPISTGAAVESPTREPQPPAEPRLPSGRLLSGVQPHPIPLSTTAQAAEPAQDELAKRQHDAQLRSEVTGTGRLLDTSA